MRLFRNIGIQMFADKTVLKADVLNRYGEKIQNWDRLIHLIGTRNRYAGRPSITHCILLLIYINISVYKKP